jgi:hypothetical protein
VTPTTYQRVDAPIERSAGKLRRLALLPVKVDVTLPIFGGLFSKDRTRAVEAQLAKIWSVRSAMLLSEDKGYDIVPVEDDGSSPAEFAALAAWAMGSGTDERPGPELARFAAAQAHRLQVDGFVVIRGLRRSPTVTTVLTLLTASLAWPLIPFESREEFRGVIVEAATGRVVWRANAWHAFFKIDEPPPPVAPQELFGSLEHALPNAVTE